MQNEIQAYQEAIKVHDAARARASEMAQFVTSVSSAIQYKFRDFMGWQYGIQTEARSERFDPKAQFDMNKWPSRETMEEVFRSWSEADTKLRQAWDAIPADQRVGLVPPPSAMRLSI